MGTSRKTGKRRNDLKTEGTQTTDITQKQPETQRKNSKKNRLDKTITGQLYFEKGVLPCISVYVTQPLYQPERRTLLQIDLFFSSYDYFHPLSFSFGGHVAQRGESFDCSNFCSLQAQDLTRKSRVSPRPTCHPVELHLFKSLISLDLNDLLVIKEYTFLIQKLFTLVQSYIKGFIVLRIMKCIRFTRSFLFSLPLQMPWAHRGLKVRAPC